MDVAQYIGQFLLKNNFCYIHGLGNLELKKRPASYDGQALQAPQYEVQITPTGSIDDNLANFIATREQISISKAANSLRDFSIQARADLAEGKDVVIPSIGKYVEQNGRIQFVTDPHLSYAPPSIPVLKTAKRLEEEPRFRTAPDPLPAGEHAPTYVNWGKILLWAGVLAVIVIGVVFGIRYMNEHNAAGAVGDMDTTQTAAPQPAAQTMAPVLDSMPPAQDTTVPTTTAPAQPAAATSNPNSYKVIVRTYDTRAKADASLKRLSSYGHTVELVARDSATYYIVMPVNRPLTADSTKVLDSMSRLFNPKGVTVYR